MGRSTKHAVRMRKQRLAETNEEKESRLRRNSERNSKYLTEENTEQRGLRLSKMRAHTKRILRKESNETRAHRLRLIRERLSQETRNQRGKRISQIHKRLLNESDKQRSHRLGLIQKRLLNESDKQRSHRLGLIQKRLLNESDKQRSHRLGLIQKRILNETENQRNHRISLNQKRLLNESSEAKRTRLSAMQQASRNRRVQFNELDFQRTINVFADVPCVVCKKTLYPQQRLNLNTGMYNSFLPDELVSFGKITTCSRCYNTIRKRKIPSLAYWNKMTPGNVPPELADLTIMEERFLCRVVPFLKIIKLQNRFSQQWCKGQVILFAKDVVEISEQLPLAPNQTGLVLVVENLENVEHFKQFVVDLNRLHRALAWLISNNILYRDVRPHFENKIDISTIVQIVKEPMNGVMTGAMNGAMNGHISELPYMSANHYVALNSNVAILRGSFHQGDERFNSQSRGKQCTGIAAIACVAFYLLDSNLWGQSDIDYILILGDKYYIECIAARENPAAGEVNPEYLAATDLLPEVLYNRERVHITVHENMNLNGHIDNDNSADGFPNLKNALLSFFRANSCGILTANGATVAVYCRSEVETCMYYLFDSHARGPKGGKAPKRGTACCMRFNDLEVLCSMLRCNLFLTRNKVTDYNNLRDNLNVFSLTSLTIVRDNRAETFDLEQDSLHPLLNQEQSEVVRSVKSTFEIHDHLQGTPHPKISQKQQMQRVDLNGYCTIIETTSMLHSIDETVPNLESVVSLNSSAVEDEIRLAKVTRKTMPPLNLDRERRMEELAWYFLFPDGKNGFGEEREIPVTPLDYFQSRVMSNDGRFNRNDYLFYALSVVEYFRAKSSVSVSCRMRQGEREQTPQGLVDNMHLTMRNIRGSASYWQKCCSELIAMVRSLGPPTWFITLSCNDLQWPDMIKALLLKEGRDISEADNLSFPERLELVQRHPVVVSRQFTLRVNALMQFLKCDQFCLGGPVEDFWYRIEFQNRGSPHLHMLVWCKNIPDFSTQEGVKVIERVVSCSLNPGNPELQKLVKDLQIHKHTASCYKNQNNQRLKNQSNCCRFGFPRAASDSTVCLGPDEALANNGRFCVLRRSTEESMVNNYNDVLLRLWKGNIDVQPCGNVTAVAYYVAKYVSKCEPHDSGDVVREAVLKAKKQGGDIWRQLFSVSMVILNQRLVSAPECAYRLCHLPLKMSSRKTVFVNSCKPGERFRLLRFDSDETSVFNNIFDRYVLRPDELEELSLAEFAVRFEVVSNTKWSEDDGDEELRTEDITPAKYIRLRNNTRMLVRNKPAVLRTRYYTLNCNKEAYYYSLLVCHVPYRNENDLLLEHETAEECFIRRQRELRPLKDTVDVEHFAHTEQIIQQALAQAVAFNAARDTNDKNNPILCGGEQQIVDDDNYCENISERAIMTDEVFLRNIHGLNIQQKDLFQKVSNTIENNLQGNNDQLLLFITGGAGSGKSFVLKLIVEHIKRCYAPTVDPLMKPHFIEVGSLTGVAARQIFGKTLHSLFSLPIERGNIMTYKKITGQKLETERRKWRHINWLIVDEISMVSYENLRIIHLRLQEYKNNSKLFGGVCILLFGDILQLPPVKGHWCFVQPHWFSAEINLWQQFSFCELTINMRQRNDIEFIDLLNSLRVGELTISQLQILSERRYVPTTGEFADGAAVRIFPTIRQVDNYNEKMTTEIEKKHRMYTINAVDESREIATYGKRPPDNVISKDVNKCGGFLPNIKLGVESRVMLRRNISVSEGLVNGAMGVIKAIKWPALRRDQLEEGELPEAVLVEFDDASIGPRLRDADGCIAIPPVITTFQASRGYGDVERRMLPLILSWAVTVHKLQGTTLDKAVIDLGKKNFAKGQIYVALSRVKTLQGIVLSDLDTNKLLIRPHDEKALAEIIRLRNQTGFQI